MEDVANALRAGIIAAQSGNKDEARAWFVQVVKADPRSEMAWLWLSSVMPTTEQAIQCLDHLLTINPANPQAREAKEILQVRLLLEEASLVEQQAASKPQSTTPRISVRLGELLVEQRVLTQAQLTQALNEQQRLARKGRPSRLGEVLISGKLIRRDQLAAALRTQIDQVRQTTHESVVTSLGQYLVQHNYITSNQLAKALSIQAEATRKGRTPKLGDVLIRNGYLTQSQLERALLEQSEEYGLHFR